MMLLVPVSVVRALHSFGVRKIGQREGTFSFLLLVVLGHAARHATNTVRMTIATRVQQYIVDSNVKRRFHCLLCSSNTPSSPFARFSFVGIFFLRSVFISGLDLI